MNCKLKEFVISICMTSQLIGADYDMRMKITPPNPQHGGYREPNRRPMNEYMRQQMEDPGEPARIRTPRERDRDYEREHQKNLDDIRKKNSEQLQKLEESHTRRTEEFAQAKASGESHLNEGRDFLEKVEQQRRDLLSQIPWGNNDAADSSKYAQAVRELRVFEDIELRTSEETEEGQRIRGVLTRRNDFVRSLDLDNPENASKAFTIRTADLSLGIADQEYAAGDADAGYFALSTSETLLDLAMGLTPGVSWAKDLYESVTGKNLVTGRDLDKFERTMAIAGAASLGVGSIANKVTKSFGVLSRIEAAGGVLKANGFKVAAENARALIAGVPHIEKGAEVLRNTPGIATTSRKLPDNGVLLRGSNGNAGHVPALISKRLEGKNFVDFDAYRKQFWKEVADSKYAAEFSQANLTLMSKGKAPLAMTGQHYGSHKKYVLHHMTPIGQGGNVYDAGNLMIVTPRFHQEVLLKPFHFGN